MLLGTVSNFLPDIKFSSTGVKQVTGLEPRW